RESRRRKRHESPAELLPRWEAENAEVGWPAGKMVAALARHQAEIPGPMTGEELAGLAAAVVGPQSLGGRKTFARRNVAAELRVSCATYGRPVADLTRAVNRVLADPEAILLVGVAGAIEQPYASAA